MWSILGAEQVTKFGGCHFQQWKISHGCLHTYFLRMSKVPPLKTSSIHIVQRWKRHKLYLIKITTKNRKKNWHRPLAIIKIFGSISGPSSFFTWTLSGMADTICWRVSSDCLVLLLSLIFVFGIVLRFSSLTYVWRLQSFLLILSVTNSSSMPSTSSAFSDTYTILICFQQPATEEK